MYRIKRVICSLLGHTDYGTYRDACLRCGWTNAELARGRRWTVDEIPSDALFRSMPSSSPITNTNTRDWLR